MAKFLYGDNIFTAIKNLSSVLKITWIVTEIKYVFVYLNCNYKLFIIKGKYKLIIII